MTSSLFGKILIDKKSALFVWVVTQNSLTSKGNGNNIRLHPSSFVY